MIIFEEKDQNFNQCLLQESLFFHDDVNYGMHEREKRESVPF